ncbi:MAG: hypothetical protein ACO36I_15885, partial [Candidatus Latescibacterota bacterium]
MNQPSKNSTTNIPSTIFCILCASIPLFMLPNLYEYALLPKRMLLQLGLFTIALIWWFDFK